MHHTPEVGFHHPGKILDGLGCGIVGEIDPSVVEDRVDLTVVGCALVGPREYRCSIRDIDVRTRDLDPCAAECSGLCEPAVVDIGEGKSSALLGESNS